MVFRSRWAKALTRKGETVAVFLMADEVACVKAGQKVPQGYYDWELMVNRVACNSEMLACGTCLDARGIGDGDLVEGARSQHVERS
jgi:uncharacterized protein involved in oxidation of intracellular sulfur